MLIGLPILIKLIRAERVPRSHEAKMVGHSVAGDWTRSEVLRDPILYILLAGTLAPGFIGTVIFFHQSYLVELRGYDPLVFAVVYPLERFPFMLDRTRRMRNSFGLLSDR